MGRQLRWVKGTPCKGQHYYLHAWHNDVMYTLTKVSVQGVERYEVWCKGEFKGIFDDRKEALNFAEGLL